MITSIQLSSILPEYKNIDSSIDEMQNLSRLNILIWANNSGKSRFLRELIKKAAGNFSDDILNISEVKEEYKWILESFHFKSPNNHILENLITWEREFNNLLYTNNSTYLWKAIKEGWSSNYWNIWENNTQRQLTTEITEYSSKYSKMFSWPEYSFQYIPILRGIKPIKWNWSSFEDEDVYKKRIARDYQVSESQIFTWLELYKTIKRLTGSWPSERRKKKEFESFLSKKFFSDKKVEITAIDQDDTIHVMIWDEKDEKAIYNLGDWIGAIINLTFSLFLYEWQKVIFGIEEPETHLHPSMQRILLETLMDKRFSTFQYFITTHSNHFLDMTIDRENISVYTFEKKWEIFEIDNIANDNMKSLELLWVRNSAVFLANCSIWVEWITDRIYLRKILELTQKWKDITYNEDYHFTFIEYGWANITHWGFLDEEDEENLDIDFSRISNKVFLISDRDDSRPWSKKAERIPKLIEKLWNKFYALECREIENLLSPKVLNGILIEDEIIEDEYPFLGYDDYKNEWLWRFLDTKYSTTKYFAESWTIKNKVKFAKQAVKHMESINDLSEEARELWEKLYEFIKSHNT